LRRRLSANASAARGGPSGAMLSVALPSSVFDVPRRFAAPQECGEQPSARTNEIQAAGGKYERAGKIEAEQHNHASRDRCRPKDQFIASHAQGSLGAGGSDL